MKEPWEEYPEIWPTKAKFFTYVRGILRKGWNRAPQKLEFLKAHRRKIPRMDKKGNIKYVWGADCEHCTKPFPQTQLQVDHKIEAGSLNSWDDVGGFTKRLLGVCSDDMRLLCIECHKCYTYASRYGVSFKDAHIKMTMGRIMKEKSKKDIDSLLEKHGLPNNNDTVRRKGVSLLIKNGVLK